MIAPRSRGGRWVIVPDGYTEAQARAMARHARRRQSRILTVLFAVAIVTGIWAAASGGGALYTHVFVDVVTIAYAGFVIHARRRQAERRRKVRSLARHPVSSRRSSWSDLDRESVAL